MLVPKKEMPPEAMKFSSQILFIFIKEEVNKVLNFHPEGVEFLTSEVIGTSERFMNKLRKWKSRASSVAIRGSQAMETQVCLKRAGEEDLLGPENKRKQESSLPSSRTISNIQSAELAQQLCREP